MSGVSLSAEAAARVREHLVAIHSRAFAQGDDLTEASVLAALGILGAATPAPAPAPVASRLDLFAAGLAGNAGLFERAVLFAEDRPDWPASIAESHARLIQSHAAAMLAAAPEAGRGEAE